MRYEGRIDLRFLLGVVVALVPPLVLILAVLGSILTGIATVNQAGAIGAMGALIMGGYRLTSGRRSAFLPSIIAIVSIAELLIVLSAYNINVKNIASAEDMRGVVLALIGTAGLLVAIVWSLWRAWTIEGHAEGGDGRDREDHLDGLHHPDRRRHADLRVPVPSAARIWCASTSPACPGGSGRSSSWSWW